RPPRSNAGRRRINRRCKCSNPGKRRGFSCASVVCASGKQQEPVRVRPVRPCRARAGSESRRLNRAPAYFISSLEIASPPFRVIILTRTCLLTWLVTAETLPSHLEKFTIPGCLLIQYV